MKGEASGHPADPSTPFPFEIEDIAISAGPVAPVPFRAKETEAFLHGKEWGQAVLEQATRVLMGEVAPRTSPHRATKEYRLELLPALLQETVEMAIQRIQTQENN